MQETTCISLISKFSSLLAEEAILKFYKNIIPASHLKLRLDSKISETECRDEMMNNVKMKYFIDCHAHVSANEFDDVSFSKSCFVI